MERPFLKCGKTSLIGLGTMMVGRAVTMYLNRGIAKSGLTINQIYALFLVDMLRGDNMSSIAKKGVMDRTTLNRVIQSYAMRDYISIHRGMPGSDCRHSFPALTNKGADILEKWMPKVLELEEALEIPTGDGESFMRFVKFFTTELSELNKNNRSIPE